MLRFVNKKATYRGTQKIFLHKRTRKKAGSKTHALHKPVKEAQGRMNIFCPSDHTHTQHNTVLPNVLLHRQSDARQTKYKRRKLNDLLVAA